MKNNSAISIIFIVLLIVVLGVCSFFFGRKYAMKDNTTHINTTNIQKESIKTNSNFETENETIKDIKQKSMFEYIGMSFNDVKSILGETYKDGDYNNTYIFENTYGIGLGSESSKVETIYTYEKNVHIYNGIYKGDKLYKLEEALGIKSVRSPDPEYDGYVFHINYKGYNVYIYTDDDTANGNITYVLVKQFH